MVENEEKEQNRREGEQKEKGKKANQTEEADVISVFM
jgi:hypothetical protein